MDEDAGARLEDADDAEGDAVTRPRSAEGARVDPAATLMDAATMIFERSSVADCGEDGRRRERTDDVTHWKTRGVTSQGGGTDDGSRTVVGMFQKMLSRVAFRPAELGGTVSMDERMAMIADE